MEEKKYTLLPADDAVQTWFEENIQKDCGASSAIYKFRQWLRSLSAESKSGPEWVKGSPKERRLYHARFKGHLSDLVHDGIIEPVTNPEYWQAIASGIRISIKDSHIIEYLDESGAAASGEREVDIDELWDEHSEHIDDDIDSLSRWAGSTVVDKEQFRTLVAQLYELFKQKEKQ